MGFHVVFMGPSGVGKSSLMERLARDCDFANIDRHETTRPRRPGESDIENRFNDPASFTLRQPEFLFDFTTYGANRYGVPMPSPLAEGEWRMRILPAAYAELFRQLMTDRVLLCAIRPPEGDPEARLYARDPWADPFDVEARMEAYEPEQAEAEAVADVVFQNRLGLDLSAFALRYLLADRLQNAPEPIR